MISYMNNPKFNEACKEIVDFNKKIASTLNKKRFYFKINENKLNNVDILERQLNIVVNRLVKTHDINHSKVTIQIGYNGNDFVNNKKTLRLTFDCN